MILMGKAQKDHKDYADFLKQVPILQHLKEEELKDMASYLKEEVIASPFMNHIRAPSSRSASVHLRWFSLGVDGADCLVCTWYMGMDM